MKAGTPPQTKGALRPSRAKKGWLLALTLFRIPLALGLLLYLHWVEAVTFPVIAIAVVVMVMIELSDLLDGILARRHGLVTELGATVDPYADSVSRLLVYSALAAADLALAVVPLCMALRDITVAYSRIMTVRGGGSASARWSGKIKAVVQAVGGFLLVLGPLYWPWTGEGIMVVFSWIVALLTLFSAVEYVNGALNALLGGRRSR